MIADLRFRETSIRNLKIKNQGSYIEILLIAYDLTSNQKSRNQQSYITILLIDDV